MRHITVPEPVVRENRRTRPITVPKHVVHENRAARYVTVRKPVVVKKRVRVERPRRLGIGEVRERIRRNIYAEVLKHLRDLPGD
ncbi:hypothetical protein ABGB18_35435 [Nonomuraea sp. B12E4]|uniref:hypothetical protein n=1 Tax=Nonomuraea sp. B12E4 TaxID=3153564 RepID=UPI00325C97F9